MRIFCFECGYSLIGSEDSSSCPECGCAFDVDEQACIVNRWLLTWKSALWWLPFKELPRGIWYVSYLDETVRLLRQRLTRWLWFPGIVTFLIVLTGVFVRVSHNVTITYYDKSRSDDVARQVLHKQVEHSFFNFNFDFKLADTDVFFESRDDWERIEERIPQDYWISAHPSIDSFAVFLGLTPMVYVLLGYFPSSTLVLQIAKRRFKDVQVLRACTDNPTWLCAVPVGLGCWLWFGLVLWDAFNEVFYIERLNWIYDFLICAASVIWAYASVFGWYKLLTNDRARVLFRCPLPLALLLGIWNIAAPAAMLWLIATRI